MNSKVPSLCGVYKEYFPVGTIVNDELVSKDSKLITKHFNSITPENELKLNKLHPDKDTFVFEEADKLVDFGRSNNMLVRGHVLVWHDHSPEWFFTNDKGEKVSREIVLGRLQEYINLVVKHFGDNIYCWDVVNEAIADDNTFYRPSRWLETIGEEFIEKAFIFAHEANPHIKLYYNDYNAEMGEKGDKVYSLIKGLLSRDVPVHGVGIQGHYDIVFHKPEALKSMIERYADLGIKLQITEMDVSVFGFDDRNNTLQRPTTELLERQAEFYEKSFEIFREYKSVIEGVTIWGVTDRYTWKDDFPVNGRKDWPLLFDESGEPKAAFNSIVSF